MLSESTKTWMVENNYDPEDIDKVGMYGNSALMKAVREGRSDLTKELIDLDADLEIFNIDGNTALWNACFGGNFHCVESLVKAGIDLNSQNDNLVTPLMYCASAGKLNMVKLLLSYGADKELKSLDGFKAIDLASTTSIYKVLRD
jgi:ankyrin repeat protein